MISTLYTWEPSKSFAERVGRMGVWGNGRKGERAKECATMHMSLHLRFPGNQITSM